MKTDTDLPEARTLLEGALHFSVAHRWAVVTVTAAVAVLGLFNLRRLPIDAVPDITNVQVQVNTIVEGLPPLEIERQVTFPIETAMAWAARIISPRF